MVVLFIHIALREFYRFFCLIPYSLLQIYITCTIHHLYTTCQIGHHGILAFGLNIFIYAQSGSSLHKL